MAMLGQLEQWVHSDLQPELTLWFDLPASVAAQRRSQARAADRFEQQDEAFFERVRTVYAQRAADAPGRFARIDAQTDVDQVAAQITAVLRARGW
jgi:dTMP kinase